MLFGYIPLSGGVFRGKAPAESETRLGSRLAAFGSPAGVGEFAAGLVASGVLVAAALLFELPSVPGLVQQTRRRIRAMEESKILRCNKALFWISTLTVFLLRSVC